eukprot:14982602-Ditylum_brightwellii.AAC.1
MVSEQAEINHGMQSVPHLELSLDDVAEHLFPEKARQTQKHYMWRNLRLVGGMIVKEWVTQVSKLNGYLKEFPTYNRNCIQPLDDDKLLDILEYIVPALWHREFTVQGFDPVDQGLRKFVEFCTRLESCEPSADKPKDKSPQGLGTQKFYCNMHGRNKTHNTNY